MARRFNPSIRPVQSLKHIVDVPTSLVFAVQSVIGVIHATPDPTLADTDEVHEGSTVNAIYLRVEAISTTSFSQVPRIYLAVFKNTTGTLTNPSANGTGNSNAKKLIIHQEMVMMSGVPATSEFPRTVFNGVIKIPPRLKRFGFNDRLNILLQLGAGETTGIVNACVQAIYKEYQ